MSDLADLEREIEELEDDIFVLKIDIEDLMSEKAQLLDDIEKLELELDELEKEENELRMTHIDSVVVISEESG